MRAHKPASKKCTLGGDRRYDAAAFVAQLRERNVTSHIAQNTSNRRSAIDGRTTRHDGYEISQKKRKRVEEVFGWTKTIALQRKTRFLGPQRTGWMFPLAAAAAIWSGYATLPTHRLSVSGGQKTGLQTRRHSAHRVSCGLSMQVFLASFCFAFPREHGRVNPCHATLRSGTTTSSKRGNAFYK